MSIFFKSATEKEYVTLCEEIQARCMALVQENSGRELHGVMERNGSYARISLADVEKEMTADQKAEARKLARELFAKIEANKAGKKN